MHTKVLASLALAAGIISLSPMLAGAQTTPNPNIDHTASAVAWDTANVLTLWGPAGEEDPNGGGQRNTSCSVTRDFVLQGEGNGNDRTVVVWIDPGDGSQLFPNLGEFDASGTAELNSDDPVKQATWTNHDFLPNGELYLQAHFYNETPNGPVEVGDAFTEVIPSCFIEDTPVTEPPTTQPPATTIPVPTPTVPLPNCEELGLTNIPSTDPNYRPDLDADSDGFACDMENRTPLTRTPISIDESQVFAGQVQQVTGNTLAYTDSNVLGRPNAETGALITLLAATGVALVLSAAAINRRPARQG